MIKSVHRSKNTYFTKCHYCICTVCSEKYCPWKDPCFNCYRKNRKIPKLDCDNFTHCFVKYYKVRKATEAKYTFCIFYKGQKIASGLTYQEMKAKTKGKPDYIVKIDKIVHPYDIW